MGSIAAIPQVCEERAIFYHQRASHFYRTISYFISTIFVDVPLSFAETILFTTLVFWMSGMNPQYVLSPAPNHTHTHTHTHTLSLCVCVSR
jgi:hypothetical protein